MVIQWISDIKLCLYHLVSLSLLTFFFYSAPSLSIELLVQITLVINDPQRTMQPLTVALAACQATCGKLIQHYCL